ncbi:uncharacterized protein LOC127845535 [Dreissena polymorpha]|nr:uncharacterized protein LOC127845535 [Dreissena polymorpha]
MNCRGGFHKRELEENYPDAHDVYDLQSYYKRRYRQQETKRSSPSQKDLFLGALSNRKDQMDNNEGIFLDYDQQFPPSEHSLKQTKQNESPFQHDGIEPTFELVGNIRIKGVPFGLKNFFVSSAIEKEPSRDLLPDGAVSLDNDLWTEVKDAIDFGGGTSKSSDDNLVNAGGPSELFD